MNLVFRFKKHKYLLSSRIKNPSLMTRLNNSGSYWVIIMYMKNLATGYGIQFLHLQFMMITGEMNQKLKMMQLMMRLLLMKILINKHKLNRYLQLHHPIYLHISEDLQFWIPFPAPRIVPRLWKTT